MSIFPKGVSTLVFVTINAKGEVLRKRKLSSPDLSQHFAMKDDGNPVFGPYMYRELTRKEIMARYGVSESKAVSIQRENYLATLVGLGSHDIECVAAAAVAQTKKAA